MNRKTFFRINGFLLLAAFAYLWNRLIQQQSETEDKNVFLPANQIIPDGISFYGDFYLSKSGSVVSAFSSRCTHAGCLMKEESNGIIVCPCHGSAFEALTGNVVKGPAFRPLTKLICSYDENRKSWMISRK